MLVEHMKERVEEFKYNKISPSSKMPLQIIFAHASPERRGGRGVPALTLSGQPKSYFLKCFFSAANL